jgi:cytochrome c peroxidase
MRLLLSIVIAALAVSCSTYPTQEDSPVKIRIPASFPEIQFPKGNEPTKLRIQLGRILFYDNRLSMDESTNCGSCHALSVAFTDGKTTSVGRAGMPGKRNAPTLANIAWSPRLMMEGGVPTLEAQALAPLHDSLEMGFNMMTAVDKLNKDKELVALAQSAYGRDSIDPFVITRALAAFQRTFVSGDSRFDRYRQGQTEEMTDLELRGMRTFYGDKAQCSSCHDGPLFTDFGYYNVGLDSIYADNGKERATHLPSDIGKFKTPTLRNIGLTAPYMHDGSMYSLMDVIRMHNAGGKPHPNKDPHIHPLQLTEDEQEELLAFLLTLTDYNFVQNKDLLPLVK